MAGTLIADRRLWLTSDKSEVVEEGDSRAATLLVAVGRGVRPDDQERLGISEGPGGKLVIKAKKAAANKMAGAPENKAAKKKAK